MKKVPVWAGAACALLLAGGAARAQSDQAKNQMDQMKSDAQTTVQKPVPQLDQLRTVKLTVKDVDPGAHKVTAEVQVSPEASFESQSGKPIKIDQLKPGDAVTAAFDPKTGQLVSARVSPASPVH
jgi:hypothetical protein